MTENDFIKIAKERGIRDENIRGAIEDFHFLKEKTLPNLELDESMIEITLKTQEKIDNTPPGMVSLD